MENYIEVFESKVHAQCINTEGNSSKLGKLKKMPVNYALDGFLGIQGYWPKT